MRRKSRNRPPSAFTLLELVVVLAILSLVTALAFRSIDQVQDQTRYEANNRLMRDIERAVVGSLDDRAIDGSPTISGFVADMGRLPKTVLVGGELTLAELWVRGALPEYNVRRADAANALPSAWADEDVYLASGWRGPYLTLNIGDDSLRDGWGNPIRSLPTVSPPDPLTSGYARLRNGAAAPFGDPIATAGQPIEIVQHLGGNGSYDINDNGVDVDFGISFRNRLDSTVTAIVEVLEIDGNPSTTHGNVVVRVFGPDPDDTPKIKVVEGAGVVNDPSNMSNVVNVSVSNATTIGPRVVRAYLDGTFKSSVKHVTLRPGVNFVPLTIYR